MTARLHPLCVLLWLVLVTSCRTAAPVPPGTSATPRDRWPKISLKQGTGPEQETRRQLELLLTRYDLSPWLFTREVQIDERAVPHSHPVLTLHTRHLRDDLLLLATFIHEQSHWYFTAKPDETRAAMAELESLLPGMPVGFPDGANDKESSYLHLCVIPFEYDGLRQLVGDLAARQVMEFWATDHYRVLYRKVLEHPRQIWPILTRHGLLPPRLEMTAVRAEQAR
ncbi:hypothetical protein ACLESO_23785 [Pyxidicoccus sp. 3LG]